MRYFYENGNSTKIHKTHTNKAEQIKWMKYILRRSIDTVTMVSKSAKFY